MWPNDISSAANNAIFKNSPQKIECRFGCVAHSAVLLKPNVANILLLNFCEQKFVQPDPITIAIDCDGFSLLIFEARLCLWTEIRTKQWLVLGAAVFQCMRAGFLYPKCHNFGCLYTRHDQNEVHLRRIGIFCKSIVRRKLHSMFCALFLENTLSAAELMSFGHLGAAIWHRWATICVVPSKISVTPTSQTQLTL